MKADQSVPTSVRLLRQHGAMNLREVTAKTAVALNAALDYADVDAVLEAARKRGEARIIGSAGDFRNQIWEAVGK